MKCSACKTYTYRKSYARVKKNNLINVYICILGDGPNDACLKSVIFLLQRRTYYNRAFTEFEAYKI